MQQITRRQGTVLRSFLLLGGQNGSRKLLGYNFKICFMLGSERSGRKVPGYSFKLFSASPSVAAGSSQGRQFPGQATTRVQF